MGRNLCSYSKIFKKNKKNKHNYFIAFMFVTTNKFFMFVLFLLLNNNANFEHWVKLPKLTHESFSFYFKKCL
jgi:hypothetical protein